MNMNSFLFNYICDNVPLISEHAETLHLTTTEIRDKQKLTWIKGWSMVAASDFGPNIRGEFDPCFLAPTGALIVIVVYYTTSAAATF